MKETQKEQLEARLGNIPAGQVAVRLCRPEGREAGLFAAKTQTITQGKGCREVYPLFPGAELSVNAFLGPGAAFRHRADPAVLEIDYCRSGRVGWAMRDGLSVYLGPGDLSVHGAEWCADSAMEFPLGYAEGVSVAVDLNCLDREGPALLGEAGVSGETLRQQFCAGKPRTVPACPALENLFAPLYETPAALRRPLAVLKVQELLLYLSHLDPDQKQLNQYLSPQAEAIRAIHRQLTEHLDRRVTIQELSRQYHINPSTLKEVFKGVYGMPIAAYMKEYRVRRATDVAVAEIAARVGYESQGKFARAFKEITGSLPTEYRRGSR